MNGKCVFVTGSSRGIGKAIAIKFASKGWNVVVNCVRPEHEAMLLSVRDEAEALGVKSLAFIGDMGDPAAVRRIFERIGEEFGGVDVLVNNAGISYIGLLQEMSPEDWDRVITANLTSAFLCSRLAIPQMLKKGAGKIVNISSVWGVSGASCEAAYSAAKGGLNALTQALAKELAPSHIQVNAIACGAIDTEMNAFLSDEELLSLIDQIPMGRLGKAEEVADLAYHLAYKDNYLTGQIIRLDGGWI